MLVVHVQEICCFKREVYKHAKAPLDELCSETSTDISRFDASSTKDIGQDC
jgi:hypothetical protein